MRPLYLFILAILTPVLLSLTLLVPSYGGILSACYYVYSGASPHPLEDKLVDVFYILDVYGQLFSHLRAHLSTVDVLHFMVPVIGLPVLSIFIALWLTRKLSRGLREMFHYVAASD